jgi:hypothetical protein
MVHGGIDEVDAAKQIVRVIEMFDEMAQSFGRIGRQVKNMVKLMSGKNLFYECTVRNGSLDKFDTRGNVILKAAAQIVQPDNMMALFQQVRRDV